MYAPRHTLFIGPGKLPDELRHLLARRVGAPQPDIAIQVPRLLAIFENASDAERIASQVQRLKIGVAVAGPEQPPAEVGWATATSFEFFDRTWRVATSTSDTQVFAPVDITAITLLDWRPDEGAADRAVLITLKEMKPVMLRASVLDTVSRNSVPMEGIRRLNEFLDAAALVLTPELKGDLLPLVLAVVDAVDTTPGQLPQPLQGKAPQSTQKPAHHSPIAALAAWVLYLVSLPSLIVSLAFFTIAVFALSDLWNLAVDVTIGVALGAWGTRRFMWSRWLAQANWGERSPIPSWPIAASEPGIQPRPLELSLDAIALASISVGALGEGLIRSISLWSLPFILLGVLTSAVAVYEAWQRE